ncbi:MAG: serine/threonine protein kinase [Myxococcales bacterium]|nr:serine/threonine protein kinase [Myxococcales bacterium]
MRLSFLFASAFCLLSVACGSPFKATTPPGFVEVEDHGYDDRYDYRATTADGLVLAVRAVDNEEGGTLEFWTRAIENQLRQQGGYALIEKVDVKTRGGVAGKQLRFGLDQETTPHLYYVSVFVTDDTVFVHEAGGTKELMTKNMAQVTASIDNLELK